jgi:hypothetical protein
VEVVKLVVVTVVVTVPLSAVVVMIGVLLSDIITWNTYTVIPLLTPICRPLRAVDKEWLSTNLDLCISGQISLELYSARDRFHEILP